MRILDIFKPTTATIEFGQRVFNLVYHVVFTTAAIVVLGALAIGIEHAAATWGATFYTFQWTAQLSNLLPITNTVHSTGLIVLIAGASTVTALIIVAFGMVAVVDRLGDPAKPIPPSLARNQQSILAKEGETVD